MLSIVIPVFDEQETLARLHEELCAVASERELEIEILFVDDGSRDSSWEVIEQIAAKDRRVRGIRFRRNFGKAAALNAGFQDARGELVFTMDADLQDDPKEIPNFLAKMEQDCDVVSGWKKVRHDPWHKVIPSRFFNAMVGFMTGVRLHDHNCGFKCYRREIFNEIRLYGELHRFVPVLAAARGWRVGEVVVEHRRREHGKSKYGLYRIVKGFLDLFTVYFLTGFGQRPQHLLGSLGLLSFVVGAGAMTLLTLAWCVSRLDTIEANDLHLHRQAIFYYSILAFLFGAQFLSAGFLAELFTAFYRQDFVPYSIKQCTNEPSLNEPPLSEPSAIPASESGSESGIEREVTSPEWNPPPNSESQEDLESQEEPPE